MKIKEDLGKIETTRNVPIVIHYTTLEINDSIHLLRDTSITSVG